jgi:hypothetical protein
MKVAKPDRAFTPAYQPKTPPTKTVLTCDTGIAILAFSSFLNLINGQPDTALKVFILL